MVARRETAAAPEEADETADSAQDLAAGKKI